MERGKRMSVVRYIESLRLAGAAFPPTPQPGLWSAEPATRAATPEAAAPNVLPPNLRAAVDAGSLLSFVSGVSSEEKDDVLYSVQLAQRAASGEFDRFGQTESWYRKYLLVLENLGWTSEQFAFARYDQSEGEFRMDQAALATIAAIATQNQLTALNEAIKSLEALTEEDGTVRLFDFHTAAQTSGNFQIGAVQKADNQALSMALGAFHFRTSDARRRFLFFAWGAEQVELWTAAKKLTLNTDFYAGHREAVKDKLGTRAKEFIAGLVLD